MLAASVLLPLVIAAVLGTAYLIETRRQESQRSALELARALATTVDSDLSQPSEYSRALLCLRLPGCSQRNFRSSLSGWRINVAGRTIHLADATGQIVWASSISQSEAIPRASDPGQHETDARHGRPCRRTRDARPFPWKGVRSARAGRQGRTRGGCAVRGRQRRPVSQGADPADVPPTWVVGIFDQDGMQVARTKFNTTGRSAPSLQALMNTGRTEGMGPTHTVEGVPSFSGFSRLKGSSWTVAVGIPQAEVQLALLPLLLSRVALASLALSAYLAMVFARRVSQPIEALKGAAGALGR